MTNATLNEILLKISRSKVRKITWKTGLKFGNITFFFFEEDGVEGSEAKGGLITE